MDRKNRPRSLSTSSEGATPKNKEEPSTTPAPRRTTAASATTHATPVRPQAPAGSGRSGIARLRARIVSPPRPPCVAAFAAASLPPPTPLTAQVSQPKPPATTDSTTSEPAGHPSPAPPVAGPSARPHRSPRSDLESDFIIAARLQESGALSGDLAQAIAMWLNDREADLASRPDLAAPAEEELNAAAAHAWLTPIPGASVGTPLAPLKRQRTDPDLNSGKPKLTCRAGDIPAKLPQPQRDPRLRTRPRVVDMDPPAPLAPHSSAALPPAPATPQVSFATIAGASISAPKGATVATASATASATATATATASVTATPAATGTTTPAKKAKYPPLVVESLPNWAHHFRALKEKLGHAPNARPFGKGIRFSPNTEEEYRAIQRYLTSLEREEKISWFSYSLPQERSLKVAIRGVPLETDPEDISKELRDLGFDPELVRPIRARKGRPGCIYFAILRRTPDLTPAIYDVTELLCMPGVKIEAWRGKKGPAQCHRCQKFRHSSHHCHRTQACVRCGEEHSAHDCPRPREEPATCANCGGPHPANNISCPVFRREARNKRAGTVAVTTGPRTKPAAATSEIILIEDTQGAQNDTGAKIRTPANLPTNRGDALKKKKKKNKKKATTVTAPPATTTSAPVTPSTTTTNGKLAILETAITVLQEVLIALRTGNEPADVVLRGMANLLKLHS